MSTIAGLITLLIAVPTCIGSGYLLFILTSAAIAPKRKRAVTARTSPLSATVVIPAHNEEDVISATLQSLAAVQPPLPVVVIADNCTDRTAQLARDAGASVIERQNKDERGKGFALAYAFDLLMNESRNGGAIAGSGADAYIVVDADTQVQPDFAVRLLAELPDDPAVPAAVQGRYGVMNGADSWRAALMSAAFDLVNHVRLLAIDHTGGCLGLKGNGMAFTRGCLAQFPMTGRSVTEDLDYAMDLMQHGGIRVQYAPHAFVCAQMPVTGEQARSQRQRWEGGRYRVVRSRAPQLLKALLSTRDGRFLGAGWSSRNCSNDLYAGVEAIDAKWNDTGKRGHLLGVRKCWFQVQLFGDEFDVAPVTFEIDIFAGERLEQLQARFDGTVPLCPVIDGLSTNQKERPSVGISEVKYLCELFQSVF
jgi:cellulose synthase/poly-beta-1,6-N-acetylglucosamine synthase-like glycosyltransferase